MTPLFKRLDEEVAVTRSELAALREKVAATEHWLARLAITRETVLSLMSESSRGDEPQTPKSCAAEVLQPARVPALGKGLLVRGSRRRRHRRHPARWTWKRRGSGCSCSWRVPGGP